MIVEIELDRYDFNHKLKDVPDHRYEDLVAALPMLEMPLPRDPTWTMSYGVPSRFVFDLAAYGQVLTELGIKYEIKRFRSTYRVKDNETHHHLHVAIPNFALLMINEVELLDDACTDALQSRLNDGWRILAVCPPACQRRPDYILGRQKKETD